MEYYSTFVSVLVDLGIDKPLDYAVPEQCIPQIRRGSQVQVPLRGQARLGYVLEIKNSTTCAKVLPLHAVISEEELLSAELFELALWMSQYYNASLRQVLKSFLPAVIRKPISYKEQFFVKRLLSKEKLREICIELREKHPTQAKVIDVLLLERHLILRSTRPLSLLLKSKSSLFKKIFPDIL